MRDRRVWITGGNSGIGAALAEACARRGARCVISARNEETLEETAADLNGRYGEGTAEAVTLDLEHRESIERAVERAAAGPPVDILFNNAGISQRALFAETEPEVLERMIAVNLTGHILLTRMVLPRMLERRRGTIVGVSSLAGMVPSPLRAGYCAAKRGLLGFYESLRLELGGTGVRVMTVIPGFVRTEISRNALEGDGSRHRVMDPNQAGGITPERCAEDILTALGRSKAVVYTGMGLKGRTALFLRRWLPGLLDTIILNSEVT
ncbi:MAG: SDR family oxidoreductase [Spirochaetia bacterium]